MAVLSTQGIAVASDSAPLVGLASLRRMINGDTSVGGPVDLARITKNGGFEWARRKSEF